MIEMFLPDGRKIEQGQELTIEGWRGRYSWMGMFGHDGSLTVWGGPPGRQKTRAVRPERVKTVHRLQKMRGHEDS